MITRRTFFASLVGLAAASTIPAPTVPAPTTSFSFLAEFDATMRAMEIQLIELLASLKQSDDPDRLRAYLHHLTAERHARLNAQDRPGSIAGTQGDIRTSR